MSRTSIYLCPGCGGPLSIATRRGGGSKCRRDGCPVQKVWYDSNGDVLDVLYSSEAKAAPLMADQLRVMAEVNVL